MSATARPQSRASDRRRTRPTLDRETVLRAGIDLLNRDGVEGVTFRRIADVLSVTPMALYRHVRDKSNLLEGMLEVVVRDAAVTGHDDPDWREWTCETYRRMLEAMLERRGVMALVSRLGSFGPITAPVVEEIFARLVGAGFSPPEASALLADLNRYMLGTVFFHGAYGPEPDVPDHERKMRAGFEMLPEAEFPQLTQHAADLAQAFSVRDLDAGFRRIIESHSASRG